MLKPVVTVRVFEQGRVEPWGPVDTVALLDRILLAARYSRRRLDVKLGTHQSYRLAASPEYGCDIVVEIEEAH